MWFLGDMEAAWLYSYHSIMMLSVSDRNSYTLTISAIEAIYNIIPLHKKKIIEKVHVTFNQLLYSMLKLYWIF